MLALKVPLIDAAQQYAIASQPKTVAAWLERLPLADPIETARQLITALYALNRHTLDADARIALLALYRPAVSRSAASLEALLAESGVPPHARQRQAGVLLRELMTEFSIGYKHALLEWSGDGTGRNARRIAETTARLLVALRDVQSAYCLSFSPMPAGLWQEIHALYQFSLDTHQPDHSSEGMPAANLTYRQALLLALADPPHLSHAELIHTRQYLDQFAILAKLTSGPVPTHRGFPVHTGGDAPPSHLPSPHSDGSLWLDTNELCRHLHQTVVRLRAGETPRRIGLAPTMDARLSLSLCRRLLKLWGSGVHRVFKRYDAPDRSVHLVAGLSAIHRLLDEMARTTQREAAEYPVPFFDASAPAAAPAAVQVTRWTASNDSATGLALMGTPDIPLNLKVGDPVAVRSDDVAEWSLAVIRWIRLHDGHQVELGLERLAPRIQPVWVRPLRGQLKANPEPALLVQGLPDSQQNDRLLLPCPLYQANMDAEVLHAPNKYALTFGQRLVHSPSFDLIDFSIFASVPHHD